MADTSIDLGEVLEGLKAIRRVLDRLESRLELTETGVRDPYKRRREVLQKIFWAGNSMGREDLLDLLQRSGTSYQWIGQQVKKGYLSVLPMPGGGTRYSATPRAVRELGLGYVEEEVGGESLSMTRVSEASFAEDWDSPEDSIYDSL